MTLAYTRVYPHYLSSGPENTIEGFRRSTSGVRVDLKRRVVVTSVDLAENELRVVDEGGDPPTRSDETPPPPSLREDSYVLRNVEEGGDHVVSYEWKRWEDLPFDLNPKYYGDFRDAPAPEEEAWKLASDGLSAIADLTKIQDRIGELRSEKALGRLSLPLPPFNFTGGLTGGLSRPSNVLAKLLNTDADRIAAHLHEQLDLQDYCSQGIPAEGEAKIRPPLFGTVERPDSFLPLPEIRDGVDSFGELIPYLILRKLAYPKLPKKGLAGVSRVLFLVLAGSLRGSARKLERMKLDLGIYGIPVEAWLLEYKEHLFTPAGRETYEAILSKDFLRDVVDRMWHLAAGMFGREPCSYETLAAKLRVSDIDRVRTAVRRIAIVTRHTKGGNRRCYTIRFSTHDWRWIPCEYCECRNNGPGGQGSVADPEYAKWHGQEWVLKRIEQLAAPGKDC